MWTYRFKDNAIKNFDKLDKNTQERIIKKLDYFCGTNYPLTFAKKLVDSRL